MSFTFDPKRLTDEELERFVRWVSVAGRSDDPRREPACREQIRRLGSGLTVENTLDLVRGAARSRPERFVPYGELWALTGKAWGLRAMGEVNAHLGRLCGWALDQRLPMFSAWFVPQASASKGELPSKSLRGFVACALDLGLHPGATEAEQRDFLGAHRDRIRQWAALG